MKIKIYNIVFTASPIFLLLMLASCEDKMLDHYQAPEWLKGSAWEVMEKDGQYQIFLEGIEASGFKPLVEGKSVLTIMAPTDNVFKSFLEKNGLASIKDMDRVELKKLIGFHLLYYTYTKDKLMNFRPEGDLATNADMDRDAGMYYKFRTRSSNDITIAKDTSGKDITIYHLERFLPIFSNKFFQTKAIDAKQNYEYFYPESEWNGNDGFNVSNASVLDYEIIADNGYIYSIDQVLIPLETIYTVLKEEEEYSEYFGLYESNSSFEYDNTLSSDYGGSIGVDSLYLHKHGNLPPIAMEWPVSSFQDIKSLAADAYSVFAISNPALNDFYERFWQKGNYPSIRSLDPLIKRHLLNQYVYKGAIVFPDEIANKKIQNSYGTYFNFDPYAIENKEICVNGSFYGLNEMRTPPLFGSVVGPAFRDKDKVSFLYALDGSALLNSYSSPEVNFTMLIPTNIQMQNGGGIFLNTYTTGSILQEETEEGWSDISSSRMQNIINMHTINSNDGLTMSGTNVYPTQIAFNYFYVKDGMITSNAEFNKILEPNFSGNPFTSFEELTYDGGKWTNGSVYTYSNENLLFNEETSDGLARTLSITNDRRLPYYLFVQLMRKANMILGEMINGLQNERFTTFIPKNEAVENALLSDKIPGIIKGKVKEDGSIDAEDLDLELLREYLYSHFIILNRNGLTTYPYSGSSMRSGSYSTANGRKIEYLDLGHEMRVQLDGRESIPVSGQYDYFPFAFKDGCFHLLEDVL